jgi:hypothetical protein
MDPYNLNSEVFVGAGFCDNMWYIGRGIVGAITASVASPIPLLF